jgi:hypothetical protein
LLLLWEGYSQILNCANGKRITQTSGSSCSSSNLYGEFKEMRNMKQCTRVRASSPAFFSQTTYSQRVILKIISAKFKCFLIRTKLKKICQISILDSSTEPEI